MLRIGLSRVSLEAHIVVNLSTIEYSSCRSAVSLGQSPIFIERMVSNTSWGCEERFSCFVLQTVNDGSDGGQDVLAVPVVAL